MRDNIEGLGQDICPFTAGEMASLAVSDSEKFEQYAASFCSQYPLTWLGDLLANCANEDEALQVFNLSYGDVCQAGGLTSITLRTNLAIPDYVILAVEKFERQHKTKLAFLVGKDSFKILSLGEKLLSFITGLREFQSFVKAYEALQKESSPTLNLESLYRSWQQQFVRSGNVAVRVNHPQKEQVTSVAQNEKQNVASMHVSDDVKKKNNSNGAKKKAEKKKEKLKSFANYVEKKLAPGSEITSAIKAIISDSNYILDQRFENVAQYFSNNLAPEAAHILSHKIILCELAIEWHDRRNDTILKQESQRLLAELVQKEKDSSASLLATIRNKQNVREEVERKKNALRELTFEMDKNVREFHWFWRDKRHDAAVKIQSLVRGRSARDDNSVSRAFFRMKENRALKETVAMLEEKLVEVYLADFKQGAERKIFHWLLSTELADDVKMKAKSEYLDIFRASADSEQEILEKSVHKIEQILSVVLNEYKKTLAEPPSEVTFETRFKTMISLKVEYDFERNLMSEFPPSWELSPELYEKIYSFYAEGNVALPPESWQAQLQQEKASEISAAK